MPSDHVKADVETANRDGLAKLMLRANAFLSENPEWALLTVVKLEKTVAAVYHRVGERKEITQFWEEDDIEV